MIKVTFKEAIFILDSGCAFKANFVFVNKVLFELNSITPVINRDTLFVHYESVDIRSIEHVNPTDL